MEKEKVWFQQGFKPLLLTKFVETTVKGFTTEDDDGKTRSVFDPTFSSITPV
jgi:hypothetical protein